MQGMNGMGIKGDEHTKMVMRKTPMKVGKNREWIWIHQSTIVDCRYGLGDNRYSFCFLALLV